MIWENETQLNQFKGKSSFNSMSNALKRKIMHLERNLQAKD